MKRSTAIIALLLLSLPFYAQTKKVRKGKSSYDSFSYSKAIKNYEAADEKSTSIKRELAESYYISGNTEKAEFYYAQVAAAKDALPEDYFRYALMLRANGKYTGSEEWIKKFSVIRPMDTRGKEYTANPMLHEALLKDEKRFEIFNLNVNSQQQDFGPSFLGDKLVFASSRALKPIGRIWNGNELPFLDVYIAKRNADGHVTAPQPFAKIVNKKYHEGPSCFSENGAVMVVTRNNYKEKSKDGTTNLEMFSSEFVKGNWTNEKAFPYNNKDYSVGHPALTPDGSVMYFVSDMPGGFGGTDIYKSVKQDDGSWGKPENLGHPLNTEGNEMYPFFHSVGMLFFASDGHVGLGGLDVFFSQVTKNGYGAIKNAGAPVNSSKDDFALILDKEMKIGYFSSNREGGKGSDDLYGFNLLKKFSFQKTISGFVKDRSGSTVPNSTVTLQDGQGNPMGTVTSGADGSYNFTVEPAQSFKLKATKESYFPGENSVSLSEDKEAYTADIIIEKDPGLSLLGIVSEKGSGQALQGVSIKLIDNATSRLESMTTSSAGEFLKPLTDSKLNDKVSFTIVLEKEGYLSRSVEFTKVLDKAGQYKLHTEIDLTLDKINVGADLSKIIDIKPIYFDLGKHAIRKDAAVELDKIVKVMNENPAMVIELGSHSDCRGTITANESLSDRRAKASAEYVKKKITNAERIYGKGFGESKLKNGCACEGTVKSTCTEAEHQENRRTEFIIIKM